MARRLDHHPAGLLGALAWRHLAQRPARTALTGLGIALGVAVVFAVTVTNATLMASFNAVFDEAGGRADLTVIGQARNSAGFDAAMLARVRQTPGVTAAAPAVQAYTLLADDLNGWQAASGPTGVAAGNLLLLMGVDPAAEAAVREVTLRAGHLLSPGERRQVVVLVTSYAEEKGYGVGDRLPILLPGGVEHLTVIGLVARSGAGLINGGAVGFVPLPVAQTLADRGGRLDRIDVVMADDVADSPERLAGARQALAAALGEGVRVLYPGARGEELAKRMTSYRLGLDLFSLVAMFVGAFLIYNTFAMNLAERTRGFGLLRAIGLTSGQVLRLVLMEALALSVIGTAAGLALGLGLAQGMAGALSVIAGSAVTPTVFPADAFIRSLAIGLGVTQASALAPALSAARLSPLQALRARAHSGAGPWRRLGWQYGPALFALGWLVFNHLPLRAEVAWPIISAATLLFMLGAALLAALVFGPLSRGLQPLARGLFGYAGGLGAASLQRAEGRGIITIATLMLGIAMSIGTTSLGDSFRFELSRWTQAALGGDLVVSSPVRLTARTAQRLAAVEGVSVISAERYMEVWHTEGAAEDELVYVAIEPETRPQLSRFIFDAAPAGSEAAAFARLAQGGAVFISTTLADRYRLTVGDTLSLDTPRGPRRFEVAGVVVDFNGNGLMVYGGWDDLRRHFGVDDVDLFILKLAPGFAAGEVADRLRAQLGERLHLTVETVQALLRSTLDIVDQSFVMFDTLAFIVVAVSALGVVNTMMIGVLERQREIALLRSVGYTRGQIRRMVLAEAAVLGVIGGGLGVGLGFLVSSMFLHFVQYLAGYALTYLVPVQALVSSVVSALVISQAAALVPAIRAAQRDIVAALKEE